MQLTGMPVNMKRVKEVKIILKKAEKEAVTKIQSSQLVQRFVDDLRWTYVCERNAKLKKKTITINDPEVSKVVFNPNSAPQLQRLLYEMLALPVLDYTDNKQPSTKAKSLESLKSHTSNPEILELLDALLDYASVAIILETFIPAMENAIEGPDGWHYLFGNFNLGGTLSGRLSSSDPNLQNIPASSKYANLIKSCFEAIFGWIFVGLDFNSLEDKISALTTKDPNKLAVYQGHLVYEVELDGETHHIRDDSTVVYDGRNFTGKEFYEWWEANSTF
jgi:DNA polymerase-1